MPFPIAAQGLRSPGAERALADRLAGQVAFLRHRIAGLEHRESSDWDLAVRDPQAAGWEAESRFGPPLLTVAKRFVIQRYFPWGQLDFLPAFEWQGIPYLDPERFWSRVKTGDDGLPRPCIAHDAFIAWMTGLLWGGHYKTRYDGMIARAMAEEPEELRHCLTAAFGEKHGSRLMQAAATGDPGQAVQQVRALRRALWLQATARDAAGTWAGQARHWQTEAAHHLRPPFPWIAVLGPDGSGKSAVLAGLRERLKPSRIGIMDAHWGPTPRREGEQPGPPVTDPHGRQPRGTLLSIAKTAWLGLRWWAARIGPVGHARSKRALLLSDRYFDDLLVDPRRYRYGAGLGWARAIFRLLPRPDRVIVLLAPAEVIRARKNEVPADELERQLAAYRELAHSLGKRAVTIDASRPLSDVIDEAFAAMMENRG